MIVIPGEFEIPSATTVREEFDSLRNRVLVGSTSTVSKLQFDIHMFAAESVLDAAVIPTCPPKAPRMLFNWKFVSLRYKLLSMYTSKKFGFPP
mmetsp:Transcript_1735/g.2456  ORF Transcript_1735/g.2456 Transcript_1735/m.2456 type:complete len:93 (-) Transcript_1735:280-558(-)